MEIKKTITICLFLFLNSFILFCNEWFDYAKEIIKNNNEPQIEYWLNQIIENTKVVNKYELGTKIYETNDLMIKEFLVNDDGFGSKEGLKAHSYELHFLDGNIISFYINQNYISLTLLDNMKKLKYKIILTKSYTEYSYGGKESKYSFKISK